MGLKLGKESISRFVESKCQRQLFLGLHDEKQGGLDGTTFPDRRPRPAIADARQTGQAWEAEKVADLIQSYRLAGSLAPILGNQVLRPRVYNVLAGGAQSKLVDGKMDLALLLDGFRKSQCDQGFLLQPEAVSTANFIQRIGLSTLWSQRDAKNERLIEIKRIIPDIIWIRPAGTYAQILMPDGSITVAAPGDTRKQLAVIDIKRAEEPRNHHFIEVAYYMWYLANWIEAQGYDNDFVIALPGFIWPGTFDPAKITKVVESQSVLVAGGTQATSCPVSGQNLLDELNKGLAEDLVEVPFEAMIQRLDTFFRRDLPFVLNAQNWDTDLFWLVHEGCDQCDFLARDPAAAQNAHPNHCHPEAERLGLITLLPDLGRGSKLELESKQVRTTSDLIAVAGQPAIFADHNRLRGGRSMLVSRALALQQNTVILKAGGRTVAIPETRETDLQIFLTVDYDPMTGLTYGFGLRTKWWNPAPSSTPGQPPKPAPPVTTSRPFVVVEPTLSEELNQLLALLQTIREEIETVGKAYGTDSLRVQFYVWNGNQVRHIRRVFGRHLLRPEVQDGFRDFMWRFPPEQLVPNAQIEVASPVSLVKAAVDQLVALPVPYDYSPLETARNYAPAWVQDFRLRVHPLFETQLSDQIPSERAHEIWTRRGHNGKRSKLTLSQLIEQMNRAIEAKLYALDCIVTRLQTDLKAQNRLLLVPRAVPIRRPRRPQGMSIDGNLWLASAEFEAASSRLEIEAMHALDTEEREARYRTAVLEERLVGLARNQALQDLDLANADPDVMVYRMRPGSREVKFDVGAFGRVMVPDEPGIIEQRMIEICGTDAMAVLAITGGANDAYRPLKSFARISILALDRDRLLIAVRPERPQAIRELERRGYLDYSRNVVIEETFSDHWTRKLEACLKGIGNPQLAIDNVDPATLTAFMEANLKSKPSKISSVTTAAEFLWGAPTLLTTQGDLLANRSTLADDVQAQLRNAAIDLNPSQWRAWRRALEYRLTLIWGPPGTGKTKTLRAIIGGFSVAALKKDQPLRILVSAFSYRAVDTVLDEVIPWLRANVDSNMVIRRLRSESEMPHGDATVDTLNKPDKPKVKELHRLLDDPHGVILVAGIPHQVYNFVARKVNDDDGEMQEGRSKSKDSPMAELFDVVIIDEASQMDVGFSLPPLCAATSTAQVVLAGDPMQLPPIHTTTPPEGAEHLTGSVYTYVKRRFASCFESPSNPEQVLEENYRSNEEIVRFNRLLGYPVTYRSIYSNQRLDLANPIQARPDNWPANLAWSPLWPRILDPDVPVVCFRYDEGKSGQSNQFESHAVACITKLFAESQPRVNLRNGPRPPAGSDPDAIHNNQTFWRNALGVVTPHSAQRSMIIGRLQNAFASDPAASPFIRSAIDTVERFQGQQSDFILASFVVSDPDLIAEEEEFLLQLNRFNVMTSRARAKLVVFVSNELLDHLARDSEVLRDSRAIKMFANQYCRDARDVVLPWFDMNGSVRDMPGQLLAYPGWRAAP